MTLIDLDLPRTGSRFSAPRGDSFATVADHRSSLRFSISAPTPDRIDEGVTRLRRAFDRVA